MSALVEPAPAPPPVAEGAFVHAFRGALIAVASLAVAAIITLPVVDLALARIFWKGIPSAGAIADHATLVLAFAAAALASLDKRHISIAGKMRREVWYGPDGRIVHFEFRTGDNSLIVAELR